MRKIIRKRKGFTLAEIMLVVALIGILTASLAVGLNKYFYNQNIDKCENELRLMINDFNSYIIDNGNITIEPGLSETEYKDSIEYFVEYFNDEYATFALDDESIKFEADTTDTGKYKSFEIQTKSKKDPWGNKYTVNINTSTYEGEGGGTVVIHSDGPNEMCNKLKYKDGDLDDDIALVIQPKHEEPLGD